MRLFYEVIDKFWNRHPALLYALSIGFGAASSFQWQWIYLLPLGLLFGPALFYFKEWTSRLNIRLALAFILMVMSGLYIYGSYLFPEKTDNKAEYRAEFSIETLSLSSNYFGKQWTYKGTLKRVYDMESGRLAGKNIPCLINLPYNKNSLRPRADKEYILQGKLKISEEGSYRFVVSKAVPWQAVNYTYSLAELRYMVKRRVVSYIEAHTSNQRSSTFLAGIATGEFKDRQMLFEFGRFGLQHILAISGFHFAIVAGILTLFLRLLVPQKWGALTLMFILCSYFLFLGPSASIMRAWIMILIVMAGYLFEKSPIGLNSLGVAVMMILLIDPLMIYRVGFQFSVIVTASILMNYSWFDYYMQSMLPKRALSEVSEMSALDQHAYCILAFFRQALSLGIAVNSAAIPLMLFYFGKFPLLSFFYNLFFPFLVSISMLLLIVGMLFWIVPPLSSLIHAINSTYTNYVLNFAYNMPVAFDYFVKYRIESFEIVMAVLSIFFFTAIFGRYRLESRRQEAQDFAFI